MPDYSCDKCPHDSDNHVLVATKDNNPMFGGVILCPIEGCECYATWSVDPAMGGAGREGLTVPDRFERARLREYIQSR